MAISFVSAANSARATSGNVTPGLPPGWTVNDIFICIVISSDNINITMPDGWVAIDGGTNNNTNEEHDHEEHGGSGIRTSVFYRRAETGDIDPLVTHPNGSDIVATISAYRGVTTSESPLDVVGTTTVNSSSTTVRANSITTLTDGACVIFTGGISSRSHFSSFSGIPIPTERVDTPYQSGYPSEFLADFLLDTAGTTGNRTCIASSSGYNNGLMFALKPISTTATIICITDPSDANIYIDDIIQGVNTPASFIIQPGSHTVTFTKSGYVSYTQTVNVLAGETIIVSVILQALLYGSLSIVTDPSNADVYIDGVLQTQQTSSTITNILAGQYTITITKDGYLPHTQTVNIVANQTANICVVLQQQLQGTGSLSIITDPTNANVYIDGVLNTQKTSITITDISVGQHTIMLTKAGYSSHTQNINIIANQTITISAILQQLSIITDAEIVGCLTSAVSSCPITPIPYTIISPLDYVNLMVIINSTQAVPMTVRFTYTINDIVNYTDITTNLTIGTNIVYAFPTNMTYPGGTVLSIGDVILI